MKQFHIKSLRKLSPRSRLLIGVALGLALLLGGFVAASAKGFVPDNYVFWPHHTHHVILMRDGFHPDTVVIREGDTITFSTNAGDPYWPASNVHPTHTEYSAFDPKRPIDPKDTWSFTFPTAGEYGFHDHVKPQFLGTVIVLDRNGSRVVTDCSKEKTQQCYEKLMRETVKDKGIAAALDLITKFAQTDPGFGADCHGYVHIIGNEAYYRYANHQDFELTPATALCGYGFYHGFMETLLQTTGDVQEARDFCTYVGQKLAGKAADAATACYHGTGHGAMDGSDPTAWGDVDKMMTPAFKLCDKIASNTLQLYLCDTGVFNATEILSTDPKYGIGDIRKEPYTFCNKQPLERLEGCYSNMLPPILENANNDFQKAADYINANMQHGDATAIDGHTINQLVTIGLMFEYMRIHGQEPDYAERAIAFCRRQPEDDHMACIEGLSGGFIKYGTPGVEYVRNLQFCANTMLTDEERDHCYAYTLPRMSGRYDKETTQKICAQVPENYRDKYCPKP